MRIPIQLMLVFSLLFQASGLWSQVFDRIYPEILNQTVSSASSVLPEPDGGFLVLMHDLAGNSGQYVLVKINAQGDPLWQRYYDLPQVSARFIMIRNADGGLTYFLTHKVNDQFDLKYVRLDALYNIVSESSMGGPSALEFASDIIPKNGTTNQYWACHGNTADTVQGGLRLLNEAGIELMPPVFTGFKNLYPKKLISMQGGGVQVIGFGKSDNSDTTRILINQYDTNGNFLVQRVYGLSEILNNVEDALVTPDGGLLLSCSGGFGYEKPYLMRLDAQGNELWKQIYTPVSGFGNQLTGLLEKPDGTGYRLVQNAPCSIMETDLDGNLLWRKSYTINTYVRGNKHLLLPNGGSLIVGEKGTYINQSSIRPWIIRTDSTGTIFNAGCFGKLSLDQNLDCIGDFDSLMANREVQFFQNGQLVNFVQTDVEGNYLLGLPPGAYVVKTPPPNPLWDSCPDSLIIQIFPDSMVSTPEIALSTSETPLHSIQGQLYQDLDSDCQADSLEYLAYANWPVYLSLYGSNGVSYNFQTLTDANGHYLFDSLLQATNALNGDIFTNNPGGNGLNCLFPCQQYLSIAAFGPLDQVYDFALTCDSLPPCPILDVSLASGNIRPCFPASLMLNYCNTGRELLVTGLLDVQIDSNLTVVSIDFPVTDLGNNHYLIDLPFLNTGQCGQITFMVSAPCDDPMGTTYCSSVYGYPDMTCAGIDSLVWDGSQIEVTGNCVGNQVVFHITNIGLEGMNAPLEYLVVEDNVLMMSAPFQLGPGQSLDITVPADGSFYRLETLQSPGAPGLSQQIAWVEGCPNNGTVSLGWVNQFYLGDPEPWYDVFCLESTNSFDPNDKQGFPRGLGSEHAIQPNTELEYLIRFQNTGTAPALYVEVRDTLALSQLDILSVRPGASSHPYTWDLQGNGIVVFKFFDINLPDSLSDPEGSNGFVQLRVKQKADLLPGTVINNHAAIYFDNNAPVITNETEHLIQTDFLLSGIKNLPPTLPGLDILPNPTSREAWLKLKTQPVQSLTLSLFDSMGRLLRNINVTSSLTRLDLGDLPKGVYLAALSQEGQVVAVSRLVKT